MRYLLLSPFFFFLIVNVSFSQESDMNYKLYKVWIKMNSEEKKTKRYLYQIQDSGMVVTKSCVKKDYTTNSFEKVNIGYQNIQTIETRARGKITRGTIIGLLSGMIAGGGIGYLAFGTTSSGSDYGPIGALIVGVPSMLVGTLVGTAIASAKKKTVIDMNYNTFRQNQEALRKLSIKKD